MRFVWSTAVKDLRRMRREPITILTWLGIPTFVALLLTLVFGRGTTRPHGTLLLVDEDRGVAATLLSGAFSQGALASMISLEKVTSEEGRRRIDKGDASALLIIPGGFTTAVIENQPAQLELIRNPAQRILPGMIQETLEMFTDGSFYLQRVAGDQLRGMASPQAPTEFQVAATAVQVNRVILRLRKYLAPPLIRLDTKVIQDQFDKPGAFATILFPSMLYMAVFFVAGGLATDVWRERTSGALRRVVQTPASLGAFLAGKLLAVAMILAATGAFGLAVAHWLLDLPIANFALANLWLAASGSGLYLLIMLLQTVASNERVAGMLSNFVMLPLSMLGGSFFPFETMPKGLAAVGKWTPNGWSLVELKNILGGSATPAAWLAVAIFVGAAWFLVVGRIRRTPC